MSQNCPVAIQMHVNTAVEPTVVLTDTGSCMNAVESKTRRKNYFAMH